MRKIVVLLICAGIRILIMFGLWVSVQSFIPREYSVMSFVVCFIAAFFLGPRTKIIKGEPRSKIQVKWFFLRSPRIY